VPLIDYTCVVGLVADISKISRPSVALTSAEFLELSVALAADISKISRASVALASAEFFRAKAIFRGGFPAVT
jgi:hypothetical protein